MLKFSSISLFIFSVLFVLFYGGMVEGAEVNVVFRGNVVNIPLGAIESSLNEADVYNVELRSFLSACGVVSMEKLIPGFEPGDTLGVTRTGEVVRLTDYSRYFILKFQDDAQADAFLADTRRSQWISIAQKPRQFKPCVSNSSAESNGASAYIVPDDPKWYQQWNLNGVWGIRLPQAWNLMSTLNRGSVYIGVLDSGLPHMPFYADHEDLAYRVDGDPFWDYGNCDAKNIDHGVGVAGIIAATVDNGKDIAGIDSYCRLHSECIVLDNENHCVDDDLTTETARSIINSIRLGVEILNMSWEFEGGFDFDVFVGSAFADAYKMNILNVVAAGNDNSSEPRWPSWFAQQVVSVGATDDRGLRVQPPDFDWGSNYGPCLDIMAPGSGYPALAYALDDPWFAGTSGAAPHVTGVASLLLSINPDLYNDDLESIMELSARDRGDPGRDDQYGWGLLNAEEAVRRILPPYSIEHCYASGNGAIHDLGTETMIFLGVPGLADEAYPSRKIKVTKEVQFSKLYANTPYAWGRGVPTRGYSAATQNFGLGYTGVSNITPNGCTLSTYTYHVYTALGQDCGWHPCEPDAVNWNYTINGIEDIVSPSVVVLNPACGAYYVSNDIMYIRWSVQDEYLQGVRCGVILNMNNGEGIWTSLGADLSVDDLGQGHLDYQVPSGQNVVYQNCIIRVIARDTNNHEGLDDSCNFTIEYEAALGGGGKKEKEPKMEAGNRISDIPEKCYLGAACPNPFNPSTQIRFGLAMSSEISLRIYDASGRLVKQLVDGYKLPGNYEAIWDGLDNRSVPMPSGVYFFQLRTASFVDTKKMVLLR